MLNRISWWIGDLFDDSPVFVFVTTIALSVICSIAIGWLILLHMVDASVSAQVFVHRYQYHQMNERQESMQKDIRRLTDDQIIIWQQIDELKRR